MENTTTKIEQTLASATDKYCYWSVDRNLETNNHNMWFPQTENTKGVIFRYIYIHVTRIFRSGTDLISLLISWSACSCWGHLFTKKPRLNRFKSDRVEIWQDCSSSKYASIVRVRFLISHHNSKMAAMTSFHAEKCCHLVSGNAGTIEICTQPFHVDCFHAVIVGKGFLINHSRYNMSKNNHAQTVIEQCLSALFN